MAGHPDENRLGSLEFVSSINGDDPIAALRALRKFVRTVRKERRLALYALPRRHPMHSDGGERVHEEGDAVRRTTTIGSLGDDDNNDNNNNNNNNVFDGGESDDDDDLQNLLEEAKESRPTKKKRRKATSSGGGEEDWKVDTAGYNVPFVGTSVIKGSAGIVQPGAWPCGLLSAYLKDSPRCVELLVGGVGGENESRNGNQLIPPNGALHKALIKSGKVKVSQALHEAYLEAIAEVATAVVPVGTLLRDLVWEYGCNGNGARLEDAASTVNSILAVIKQHKSEDARTSKDSAQKYDIIASIMVREHLRPLLHLLNDQCSKATSFDAKHGGGGGKGGGRHRVGPLTSTVLRVLANIAAGGVGAAREVVRGLDAELREGALRAALASFSGGTDAAPPSGKKRKAPDADADADNEAVKPTTKKKESSSVDARTAALRLCSVLVESADHTVLSLSCSPGSRERKTNAGIAHTTLRVGLAGGLFDNRAAPLGNISAAMLEGKERYLQSVGRMLTAVRTSILPRTDGSRLAKDGRSGRATTFRTGLDGRTISELFNGDVMDRLMRISAFAPSLSDTESYKAVLSASDVYANEGEHHTQVLSLAAVQCRRLLFTLLADEDRSPFLAHIHAADGTRDAGGRSSPQEHLVTRALLSLVANEHGLPIRSFILHSLHTTPSLMFPLFRSLPMPDPKATYECLSALAFVSNLVTEGPSVSACMSRDVTARADQVIPFIMPTSLSKAFLTKSVQSTNALLVAEVLRVICDVLKRAEIFSSASHSVPLGDSLQKRLPDLQILLALRTRFDPFAAESDDDDMVEEESPVLSKQDVVTLRLCETLQLCGRVLPSTALSGVKFDWAKLFPSDLTSFFCVSSTVQLAILKTFDAVGMQARKNALALPLKSFRSFLTISMASTAPHVYELSRKLAINAILGNTPTATKNQLESRSCLEYEASLWVAGVSAETLDEICKLVSASPQSSVQHTLSVSRAWSSMFPTEPVPPVFFSSLLSGAIAAAYLCSSGFSRGFIGLVCQLATKSLLYHRSPECLAVFIKYCSERSSAKYKGDDPRNLLYRYCFDSLDESPVRSFDLLDLLVERLFGKNSLHSQICIVERGASDHTPEVVDAGASDVIIRQCLNRLVTIRNLPGGRESRQRLHRLLQRALVCSSETGRDEAVRSILEHPYILAGCSSMTEMTNLIVSLPSCSPACRTAFDAFARSWLCRFVEDNAAVNLNKSFAALAALLASVAGPSFSMTLMKLLLERCAAEGQPAGEEVLCHTLFLTIMNAANNEARVDNTVPVHHLLKLWATLASSHGEDEVNIPLRLKLEDTMCSILSDSNEQGLLAAKLSICLREDIKTVLDRYAISSVTSDSGVEAPASNLLATMIEYDCAKFVPPLAKWLNPSKADSLKRQMGERYDSTFDLMLIAYMKQLGRESDTTPSSSTLITLSWQRISSIFAQGSKEVVAGWFLQVKDWFPILSVLLSDNGIAKSRAEALFDQVLAFFEILATRPRLKLGAFDEEAVLGAAVELFIGFPAETLAFDRFGAYLFLRLGALLPRALRKSHSGKSNGKQTKEHQPNFILLSMIRILVNGCEIDADIILMNEANIRGSLVSCLKYGISDADKDDAASDIAGLCLQLARLIVVKASTDLEDLSRRIGLLMPAQVHQMATSHSNFQAAITRSRTVDEGLAEENPESPRLELIYLLICCASLDPSALEISDDTWSVVLQGYHAGVNREDKALRRLMHLYNAASKEEENIRFMNTFQWGVTSEAAAVSNAKESSLDGSDHAGHYEWFVQALDIRRIRSTLMAFPIWDRLVPDADLEVEPWMAIVDGKKSSADDESDEEGSAQPEHESSVDSTPEEGKAFSDGSRLKFREDKSDRWRRQGHDDRYSPAFVITLILGTLEAFNPPAGPKEVPERQQDDGESRGNDDSGSDHDAMSIEEDKCKPHRESFVKIARRLGDKGCIGLTLAALSSKCPDLRRLSIATLGLFLKAVHMQEAQELKTWRERPQIAMILDSVQRGLVVRRAISMARRKEEGTGDQPLLVPMFPAVSAVFLAWASLIVSRPSDGMYASANRSFLRLEEYHGAYKDIFALPAFITLFCGSFAKDNSQARKERLWALQLIKDGARDAYCYKVAARRHAPALIMSSFDSLVSRGGLYEADAEPYLLIEALESLLVNGGRMARHHLICSVGLLSWMRGLLVARLHSSLFPSPKMLYTFLRLIASAFQCAVQQANEEPDSLGDPRAEAFGMAGPLVDAYMACIENADAQSKGPDDPLRLLVKALDIMSTLSLVGFNEDVAFIDSFREDGIGIPAALTLVKSTGGSLHNKAVGALCSLPLFAAPSDDAVGKMLCLNMLSFVSDSDAETNLSLFSSVLMRVSHIINVFCDVWSCDDMDLIEAVLACKMKAQWCKGGIAALTSCLSSLLQSHTVKEQDGKQSEAVVVAIQLLRDTS